MGGIIGVWSFRKTPNHVRVWTGTGVGASWAVLTPPTSRFWTGDAVEAVAAATAATTMAENFIVKL